MGSREGRISEPFLWPPEQDRLLPGPGVLKGSSRRQVSTSQGCWRQYFVGEVAVVCVCGGETGSSELSDPL